MIMEFFSATDIINFAEMKMEEYLQENAIKAKARDLDIHMCVGGFNVFATDKEIILLHEGSVKTMNYYAGFEYVPTENLQKIGYFTIYTADGDGRVEDMIAKVKEKAVKQEEHFDVV